MGGPTQRGGGLGFGEEAIGMSEEPMIGGESKRWEAVELPIRECRRLLGCSVEKGCSKGAKTT